MKIRDASLCLLILVYTISAVSANSVYGCGGFLGASSSVIKSRKETDAKLDYSHIYCSFVIKISGPEGWSWDPDKVPVVIDDNGCNNNEDIDFRFTGFTLSGRVVGAFGGQSCSVKNGGPANVTGFSIEGRVIDANDIGVEGVKILVDGQERSITDKEGYYKLDQVTSNHYTIEAKKEHYKFNKLKDYLVKPNMASVSDIKAVSYDVCGVVRTFESGYKAKVALTHGPENVKPQVKHTDESGSFCFEVLQVLNTIRKRQKTTTFIAMPYAISIGSSLIIFLAETTLPQP